jgi:predicted Rossmann fold nucleotide-binding protein DprA/Smf involved in DNA uptake
LQDEAYPRLLKEISAAPPLLFIQETRCETPIKKQEANFALFLRFILKTIS